VTGFGQCHDIAAAVLTRGLSRHQTLCLQRIEHPDHGGAVDPQSGGRLLLGLGLPSLQEQQHRELATVDAERRQRFAVQFFQVEESTFQQIGQPRGDDDLTQRQVFVAIVVQGSHWTRWWCNWVQKQRDLSDIVRRAT
jgi:hypothetical protein